MHGIAVALLTEDREQLVILQNRLESTHVARTVFSHLGFPISATDAIVRQVQDSRAEVVLIDVNADNPQTSGLRRIRLRAKQAEHLRHEFSRRSPHRMPFVRDADRD